VLAADGASLQRAGRAAGAGRRPRAGSRAAGRGGAGVRWDRVGRVALLVVLVFVLYLYVGPARAWYGAWREAGLKRAEVVELQARNADLRQRKRALSGPGAVEREARKLGMVRSGEQAYVVQGLPGR